MYFFGFDGFSDKNENYFDEHLEFLSDYKQLEEVNQAVKERLNELSKNLRVDNFPIYVRTFFSSS